MDSKVSGQDSAPPLEHVSSPPPPRTVEAASEFKTGQWLAVFEPPKYFKICQVVEAGKDGDTQLHVVRFQPDSQPPDTYIKLNDGSIEVRNIICRTHLQPLRHGRFRLPLEEKATIVREMQRLDPALLDELSKNFQAIVANGELRMVLNLSAIDDKPDDAASSSKSAAVLPAAKTPAKTQPAAKPSRSKADKDSDIVAIKPESALAAPTSAADEDPPQSKRRKKDAAPAKTDPKTAQAQSKKNTKFAAEPLSPTQLANEPHKTLKDSLEILGLQQYYDVLLDSGYDDLRFIPGIVKEDDLVKIGFKIGHAQRFLRSLKPV
eukprot:TRINITY_DN31008_c0_g1_i1.p1 TRINITY_DN31008_c0_g1~~TRINITY_DN31008_c0_g1_i1.p1  ORF type:complete len:320 (-),score=116.59 TRINITY_DN31008_c0_g1_i1:85-1044(-)